MNPTKRATIVSIECLLLEKLLERPKEKLLCEALTEALAGQIRGGGEEE